MTSPSIRPGRAGTPSAPALEFPLSLAVYPEYAQAQQAVDYLSGHRFPVQNLQIVGSGLISVERVTGRLSRRKIAVAGMVAGFWLGVFVGLVFAVFGNLQVWFVAAAPLVGALCGLLWSQLAVDVPGRERGYASTNQMIAASYEILVEHSVAAQARELLAGRPKR